MRTPCTLPLDPPLTYKTKNYASLAAMQRKRSYFVKNDSSRPPGQVCSYGNIFIPVTESRLLIYTRQNVYERKSSVDRTHMKRSLKGRGEGGGEDSSMAGG